MDGLVRNLLIFLTHSATFGRDGGTSTNRTTRWRLLSLKHNYLFAILEEMKRNQTQRVWIKAKLMPVHRTGGKIERRGGDVLICLFVSFLTSSSTTRLYRGRAARQSV